jgi:hypothetical protein
MKEAEASGRRATIIAYNAGKGLWHVRRCFRNRRPQLKIEGKKLKDEQTWTEWCELNQWSRATIGRYIEVYERCEDNPALLERTLAQIYNPDEWVSVEGTGEPLPIGCQRWVQADGRIWSEEGEIVLHAGDEVRLQSVVDDDGHWWEVVSGVSAGKVLEMRPSDKLCKLVEVLPPVQLLYFSVILIHCPSVCLVTFEIDAIFSSCVPDSRTSVHCL